jgi:hypothetical protein
LRGECFREMKLLFDFIFVRKCAVLLSLRFVSEK